MAEHKILIPEDKIAKRVKELGQEITAAYAPGTEIYLVNIANGAIVFTADLIRAIPNMLFLDTIKTKSYVGSTSGEFHLLSTFNFDLKDKHVILVDDILDTGKTLKRVMDLILEMKPASLRTCVLLDKPEAHDKTIRADFVGFEIPQKFIFGYGLDDDKNRYRNLPYIGCN